MIVSFGFVRRFAVCDVVDARSYDRFFSVALIDCFDWLESSVNRWNSCRSNHCVHVAPMLVFDFR